MVKMPIRRPLMQGGVIIGAHTRQSYHSNHDNKTRGRKETVTSDIHVPRQVKGRVYTKQVRVQETDQDNVWYRAQTCASTCTGAFRYTNGAPKTKISETHLRSHKSRIEQEPSGASTQASATPTTARMDITTDVYKVWE